jgi:hypothetical protein
MLINKEYIKDLMRPFVAIFIKYFSFFFVIVVVLVAIGQYHDQRTINLRTSISFTFPLALLGGAIASLFIGLFRKLDATPPWVEASHFIEINKEALNKGLVKIRRKRRYLGAMFFLWLPFGALLMAINLPFYLAFIYMVVMAINSQLLYFSKCPRCNNYFFYRSKPGSIGDTGNQKLNLLFGGGYRNIVTNKCLNCGLNINNENSI